MIKRKPAESCPGRRIKVYIRYEEEEEARLNPTRAKVKTSTKGVDLKSLVMKRERARCEVVAFSLRCFLLVVDSAGDLCCVYLHVRGRRRKA